MPVNFQELKMISSVSQFLSPHPTNSPVVGYFLKSSRTGFRSNILWLREIYSKLYIL